MKGTCTRNPIFLFLKTELNTSQARKTQFSSASIQLGFKGYQCECESDMEDLLKLHRQSL